MTQPVAHPPLHLAPRVTSAAIAITFIAPPRFVIRAQVTPEQGACKPGTCRDFGSMRDSMEAH